MTFNVIYKTRKIFSNYLITIEVDILVVRHITVVDLLLPHDDSGFTTELKCILYNLYFRFVLR